MSKAGYKWMLQWGDESVNGKPGDNLSISVHPCISARQIMHANLAAAACSLRLCNAADHHSPVTKGYLPGQACFAWGLGPGKSDWLHTEKREIIMGGANGDVVAGRCYPI